MAIFSFNISNVSRSKGASSCATLAYISGQKVYEERTGTTYYYGHKGRVVWVSTVLPDYAPARYEDPIILFNSI